MKDFVNQRLTAAAEEICELFESILAEYEEQVCRQQKLLDAVFNPEVRLCGAGKYSSARCVIRYMSLLVITSEKRFNSLFSTPLSCHLMCVFSVHFVFRNKR